jgi:hypothetical protein
MELEAGLPHRGIDGFGRLITDPTPARRSPSSESAFAGQP